MEIHNHKETYLLIANRMLERGDSFTAIEEHLLKHGATREELEELLKYIKEEHRKKQHRIGLTILLIGLFVLLTSFILTCINFHANASIVNVMFGISTVGLIVVFIGLYYLFG